MVRVETLQGDWEIVGEQIYNNKIRKWVDQSDFALGAKFTFRALYERREVEQGIVLFDNYVLFGRREMGYLYVPKKRHIVIGIEQQNVYDVRVTKIGSYEEPIIRLRLIVDKKAQNTCLLLRRV
ncbi:MAG: hypothetical protein R3Y68_05035 [Rikenellaceae bacterium]